MRHPPQNLPAAAADESRPRSHRAGAGGPARYAGDACAGSALSDLRAGARTDSQYRLRRICGTQLPHGGGLQLLLEGAAAAAPIAVISGESPSADTAAYEAVGCSELRRLQAELAAAGQPVGLELKAAAAAAWRKKVLLAWAPRLHSLLESEGIQ